jgi:ATP-dependent DNA ligase
VQNDTGMVGRGFPVSRAHRGGRRRHRIAHACKLGLEGIVSKRRDKPYQHGRSRARLKIKNPASPAAKRIEDGTF